MYRQPHTAPLFPYTTLFRSGRTAAAPVVQLEEVKAVGAAQERGDFSRLHLLQRFGEQRGQPVRVAPAHGAALERVRRDRKSTRLNSSHLGISYAVFCLKKKN